MTPTPEQALKLDAMRKRYEHEPMLSPEERAHHIEIETARIMKAQGDPKDAVAVEFGFPDYESAKRALMPTTTVSVVEHSRVQGERRVR